MSLAQEQLVAARREIMTAPMMPMLLINGQSLTISNEIPLGFKTFEFKITKRYGTAQVMTSRATNVPLIGDSEEINIVRVYPVKEAFDLDEDQLLIYRANGKNLITDKLIQARDSIDQKLDLLGFLGEPGTTLLGISNYPGVTIQQMPADGNQNGGTNSRQWQHKTVDQVIRDMNLIATGVQAQTAGTVSSNRLLLGHSVALYLQNRTYNDRGESLLKVFLDNQRILANGIREVIGHPSLDGVGVGGASRCVAYNTASRYNKFHIPQGGGFTDSGLDKKGDVWYLECKAKTAGVEIQRIKELIYSDILL